MKDNIYFFEEIDGGVRKIPFYALKIGEFFKHKGKKYKKTDDETGKLRKNIQLFWPQESVNLIKSLKRSVLIEKYPELGRYYYS